MTREEEFLIRLLATFKIEAEEHVSGIYAGLIELEKQHPPERQKEIIEVIFREAHSLKGAARSVNLIHVELVCQSLESLFAGLKRGDLVFSTALFDLLNDAMDLVNRLLSLPDASLTTEDRAAVQVVKQRLSDAAKGKITALERGERSAANGPAPKRTAAPAPAPAPAPEREPGKRPEPSRENDPGPASAPAGEAVPPLRSQTEAARTREAGRGAVGAETVRIPAAKLDALLLTAEELVAAKLAARQHATLARELKALFDAWQEQSSRIKTDVAVNALKEYRDLDRRFGRELEGKLSTLAKSTEEDARSIAGLVDSLLEETKGIMMLPFSSVLDTFPKLVRDIAREQGKEIDFAVQGGEIEIDKRILQEIKTPLIHLVRNCIDHGMDDAEARKRLGKGAKGSLRITVNQKDSGKVEIMVSDDGAGIDLDRVRESAVRLGLVVPEQAATLGREETLNLIFESGISTSPLITTVSGRGLGMAIVREKVEKLGGAISVRTKAGEGTSFGILLPLSLATFRAILIETGGQVFAVPTVNVERIVAVARDEIRTVEMRETVPLNGAAVSLVRLDQVLELVPRGDDGEQSLQLAMVVAAGEKLLAFAIDRLLDEDEILLKGLGRQLSRVRNIAGATVLGSGRVVPILNVSDLVKSVLKSTAAGFRVPPAVPGERGGRKQSILVVEDSITARTLFVNILESSGYEITAAVDGLDAVGKLSEGEFDLVVTDIAMPRMNGFELTERIRADRKYAELPVVIVTGLESAEDKKRGVEVGANAYLVKSSFDQSNLVEVIQRLI